jgi:hypothetical protein
MMNDEYCIISLFTMTFFIFLTASTRTYPHLPTSSITQIKVLVRFLKQLPTILLVFA